MFKRLLNPTLTGDEGAENKEVLKEDRPPRRTSRCPPCRRTCSRPCRAYPRNCSTASLTGHDHVYERIKPQKGIQYFVVGNSAKVRKGDEGKTIDAGTVHRNRQPNAPANAPPSTVTVPKPPAKK